MNFRVSKERESLFLERADHNRRRPFFLSVVLLIALLFGWFGSELCAQEKRSEISYKRFLVPNIVDDVVFMPQEGELMNNDFYHMGSNQITEMCLTYMPSGGNLKIGAKCLDMSELLFYEGGLGKIAVTDCVNKKRNMHQKFYIDKEKSMIQVFSQDTCVEAREVDGNGPYTFLLSQCDENNRRQKFYFDGRLIRGGMNNNQCFSKGVDDYIRFEKCNASDSNQKVYGYDLDSNTIQGIEIVQKGEPFMIRHKSGGCLSVSSSKVISEKCDGSKTAQQFEYDPVNKTLVDPISKLCLKGGISASVLKMDSCNSIPEMQFSYSGNAIYQFGTLYCVDVFSTSSVQTKTCASSDSQTMYIIPLEKNGTSGLIGPIKTYNSTFLLKHVLTERCIDDMSAISSGNSVWSFPCDTNNVNQYFEYLSDSKQLKNPYKDLCLSSDLTVDECDTEKDNQKFSINELSVYSNYLKKCLSLVSTQSDNFVYSFKNCDSTDNNQLIFTLDLTKHRRGHPMVLSTKYGTSISSNPSIKYDNIETPFLIVTNAGCYSYSESNSNSIIFASCDPFDKLQQFKYDNSRKRIVGYNSGLCLDDNGDVTSIKMKSCDSTKTSQMIFYSYQQQYMFNMYFTKCIDTDGSVSGKRAPKTHECLRMHENQRTLILDSTISFTNPTTTYIVQHVGTGKCLDDNNLDGSSTSLRLHNCDTMNINQRFSSEKSLKTIKNYCLSSDLTFKPCQASNEFYFTYTSNVFTLQSDSKLQCLSYSTKFEWVSCSSTSLNRLFKIINVNSDRKLQLFSTFGSLSYNPSFETKNKENPFLINFNTGCLFSSSDLLDIVYKVPCDVSNNKQLFTFDNTVGKIIHVQSKKCLDNRDRTDALFLGTCDSKSENQKFIYDASIRAIRDLQTNRVLEVSSSTNELPFQKAYSIDVSNQKVALIEMKWTSETTASPFTLPTNSKFLLRNAYSTLCITSMGSLQPASLTVCDPNNVKQQFTYDSTRKILSVDGMCFGYDSTTYTCYSGTLYETEYTNSFNIKSIKYNTYCLGGEIGKIGLVTCDSSAIKYKYYPIELPTLRKFTPTVINYGHYNVALTSHSLYYVGHDGSVVNDQTSLAFQEKKCFTLEKDEKLLYLYFMNTPKKGNVISMLTDRRKQKHFGTNLFETMSSKLLDLDFSLYQRKEDGETNMIGSEYSDRKGFSLIGLKGRFENSVETDVTDTKQYLTSLKPILKKHSTEKLNFGVVYGKVVGRKYLPNNMMFMDNRRNVLNLCCTNVPSETSAKVSFGGIMFRTKTATMGTSSIQLNSKCIDISEGESIIWETRSYFVRGIDGLVVPFFRIRTRTATLTCDSGTEKLATGFLYETVIDNGVLVGIYGAYEYTAPNYPEILSIGPIWKKRVKEYVMKNYILHEEQAIVGKSTTKSVATETLINKSSKKQTMSISGSYTSSSETTTLTEGGSTSTKDISTAFSVSEGLGVTGGAGMVGVLEANFEILVTGSQGGSAERSDSFEKTWKNGTAAVVEETFSYEFPISVPAKSTISASIIYTEKETTIPWSGIIETKYYDETSELSIVKGVYNVPSYKTVTAQVNEETSVCCG